MLELQLAHPPQDLQAETESKPAPERLGTHASGPSSNLDTMNGARTITFDSKTNHILTMSQERGPAPPPPAGGGRGRPGAPVPNSFTILIVGK